MMGWFKSLAYRNDTLAQIQMMMLMIGPGEGKLLGKHVGVRDAIRIYQRDGYDTMVTATHVCAALIAAAIHRDDDIVRKQIVHQLLTEWSALEPAEQRSISREMAEGTLRQDMLLTRCQWLLLRGQNLLLDKRIELHDFRILKDSIYGPLNGDASSERTTARLREMLRDAFSPGS